MSTDITIADRSRDDRSFDLFIRDESAALARAARVVTADQNMADAAIDAGMRSAHDSWPMLETTDQARQHVFRAFVAQCRHDFADVPNVVGDQEALIARACVVAHHAFGWRVETIAEMLTVPLDDVAEHLRAHAQAASPEDGADLIRTEVRQAEPAQFDLNTRIDDTTMRHRRRLTTIVSAALLLILVVALAQLVARPSRDTAIADAAPEPTATPVPSPTSAPTTSATPAVAAIQVVEPALIASDGEGGFVGITGIDDPSTDLRFVRSTDGQTWNWAQRWDVDPDVTVTRFERSGDQFAIWLDQPTPRAEPPVAAVAVSSDLSNWVTVQLATGDEQPLGLRYDSQISELAISNGTVLALVTTQVQIDFAALNLSESYTCGHSIANDAVSVNLCNDARLDVLAISQVARLPKPARLFVSRAGQPFERATEPFSAQTKPRLTATQQGFAIADDAGVRFATSSDGDLWQTLATSKPPLTVIAAATNDAGQTVGVGAFDNSGPVVFQKTGPTTITTPLNLLIDGLAGPTQVMIAPGPSAWVVYVEQSGERAWILTSPDGFDWVVVPLPTPVGTNPRMVVGDRDVLVQWTDDDGTIATIPIELPQ